MLSQISARHLNVERQISKGKPKENQKENIRFALYTQNTQDTQNKNENVWMLIPSLCVYILDSFFLYFCPPSIKRPLQMRVDMTKTRVDLSPSLEV